MNSSVVAGDVIRVVLIDDHPVVHVGVRTLFAGEEDIEMVAEVHDADRAISAIEDAGADLAIVDLSLGPSKPSGVRLVRDIRDHFGERVRVLVLTMHDEMLYAGKAVRAGAHGYVTKREAGRELVNAVRAVAAGDVYTRAAVRGEQDEVAGIDVTLTLRSLSDREFEVYEMLGAGLATREIAERLGVSVKTVETHRTRIKAKLGITSTQQLIRSAVQWATLDTDERISDEN